MKKILVIDDDPFFKKAISSAVDPSAYEVSFAVDGEDGLKKVEESVPDIILLDILMPKMNGLEFLKQLNEKYGSNKIPVLITSNLSSMEKISEGVELGVRGYIIKSDESIKTIVSTIESLLK